MVDLTLQRNLLAELTRREFSSRYQGSFGGVLWSFAQPLFLLVVYTLAFGVILQTRWDAGNSAANGTGGGTRDYALLLFAGLIVFNLFSECLLKSAQLIVGNPNFVKKIVFPLALLPVVSAFSALLHAGIALLIWLGGYSLLVGVPHATVVFTPFILLSFFPVLLGIGWLLSALAVIVRDIGQMLSMVSHSLMFLTPIFYSIDMLPAGLRPIMLLNPLTFIIGQLRAVLYYGAFPDFTGLLIYFCGACLFATAGFTVFRSLRPYFADHV